MRFTLLLAIKVSKRKSKRKNDLLDEEGFRGKEVEVLWKLIRSPF